MSVSLLMESLKKFIEAEFAGDVSTTPHVHLGSLPKLRPGDPEGYRTPYIVIRPDSGTDTEMDSETQIKLIFGIKDDDGVEAIMTLTNIMERFRIAIQRRVMIANLYQLKKPYTWKIFDEQPIPYYEGEVTTKWDTPPIFREVPNI